MNPIGDQPREEHPERQIPGEFFSVPRKIFQSHSLESVALQGRPKILDSAGNYPDFLASLQAKTPFTSPFNFPAHAMQLPLNGCQAKYS
jgi:hypothetical protein